MMQLARPLFDAQMSVGEKTSVALVTIVFGMLVVFAVLTLIMLVITVVGKIFQKIDKKKAAKSVPAPVITEPTPVEEESTEDEGAIVAAITAAIALCMEEQPGSFRVVSFKKTSAKPAWNKK